MKWAALRAQVPPRTITYRVAPGTGQEVRWTARTNTESYAGATNDIEGELRLRPDRPADGAYARFVVRPASFLTGNSTRDSNMRRRHLETDRFASAVFTLTGLKTTHSGPLPYNIPLNGTAEGTLLLHGISRVITPDATVTRERDAQKRDVLHLVAHFVVRLNDYKIPVPRFLFFAVKQEHPVTVDIRAVAIP